MIYSKFKIGDSVGIINDGKIYTTYYRMFHKLGFKDTEVNATLPYGIGKVFGIDVHELDSNDILIAIRDEYGNECLIDECGLKHEFDMNTDEGRLAYAKKHYPVGTKYKSLYSGQELIVGSYDGHLCLQSEGIWSVYNPSTNEWAEIIEDKQEEKVMETQKLSREGLKEIHSVACPNWKDVLAHYGARNPLENYIELTQDEVDKMFKACTKEQLPIVSKYLKQDDSSVDVTKFKVEGKGILDDNKSSYIIRDREMGKYRKKSFLLSQWYDWEIKEDELGFLCLIPTKKK
jgi:hypothetical protein